MAAWSVQRRSSRPVSVGDVIIGGGAPVSVQGMTKTHTEDVEATVSQIRSLADSGCEIARCAVPNHRAAEELAAIKNGSPLPLIADVHFQPGLALKAIGEGVDGVRVNPGNMKDKKGLRQVFNAARERDIKVRIGVNSGSVRPRKGLEVDEAAEEAERDMAELMLAEALDCCRLAEDTGFRNIVLSLKGSDVPTTMRAYRVAAERTNYPLHVGVTAAGPPRDSIIKSSIGIGGLLAEGIGDTIRVSMTGPPEEEVRAGIRILEAVGLRERPGPEIVSCPTCGRCHVDLAQIVDEVEERLKDIRTNVTVAVMGCVVNGPGEAAEAEVGLAAGKDGGFIFRHGEKVKKVASSELVDALVHEVEKLQ